MLQKVLKLAARFCKLALLLQGFLKLDCCLVRLNFTRRQLGLGDGFGPAAFESAGPSHGRNHP